MCNFGDRKIISHFIVGGEGGGAGMEDAEDYGGEEVFGVHGCALGCGMCCLFILRFPFSLSRHSLKTF